ncbi:MAG TPA: bacillithiol system redox-active protein YtxJ [Blastocatellia bacterium]|nr:bacillithiol system redox-active protein YtxJ [Blastocatellia bacterium]
MNKAFTDLNNTQELDHAIEESAHHPVLLFKHSLTCPISSRAFRQFEAYLEDPNPRAAYKLITIQEARPVSDEAALKLDVPHESPQAILVRNGKSVWTASHFDITAESLREVIDANTK